MRPFIFIVYSDYEHVLAKALKGLLESWGFDAFFCRQESRVLATAKSYRQDLAEKLANADLVILVLSNAFRQSPYCQAEAGATVTLDKPHIQIMIPPVSYPTIKDVSPVIEGWHIIDGGQPLTVVDELRAQLAGTPKFSELGLPRTTDPHAEKTWTDTLDAALVEAVARYRIEPPSRVSIGFWDTLTDASRSIIDNIREAVATGETHVAVVGVSLKYSIHILTTAIEEAAADAKASGQPAGPLTIELVHVDDQAYILHSLEDTIDIGNVLDYLRIGWPQRKSYWKDTCAKAGIKIHIEDPVAIDYIPQQVGIRIHGLPGDSSVLYAGSCSFAHRGQQVTLLVGEREYFYYSSRSANLLATKAIAVFNQYLAQYRSPHNSGATLVINHLQWITRLEECVLRYPDLKQLVLVSNTSQRFFQLIIPALQRHLTVKVYTSHPELLSSREGALVDALEERLDQEIATRLPADWSGAVELWHCRTPPTFRAALIGDAVLGMQAYTFNGNPRPASAGRQDDPHQRTTISLINTELRLIATRYSEHFQMLRADINRQCGWADPEPYCVRRGA
jgi:hypothetical protein